MYLADDDLIDGDGLKDALDKLIADPEAVILYAPWTLYNLIEDKPLQNFYDIPGDTVVNRGNFLHLLLLILQNHIFAEIAVVRTEAFRTLLPRENDLAYWAFTIPAEYLTIGKVLFQKKPFYKSITGYFADEQRSQGGIGEVQDSWDRYRGGLEHLFGLSLPHLKETDIPLVQDNIQQFLVKRMLVALKIRLSLNEDPIQSYYLASRLRGLGAAAHLPKPLANIRGEAALWFVSHDETMVAGTQSIALVGDFDASVLDYLKSITDLEVSCHDALPADVENAILILKGSQAHYGDTLQALRQGGNKIVFEDILLNKFI